MKIAKKIVLIASIALFIFFLVSIIADWSIGNFPLLLLALTVVTSGIISIKEGSKVEGYVNSVLAGMLLIVSSLGLFL
ncbi:hypothetical protein CEH05_05235 [Halobacillus halophilus]|uniref:hypothetical protein n=1 Tax=Halobacillus halophilus TaxID=1570 RepID=UPI000314AAA1|nr:hypothetical protein [Halobacillus halophilus]ASF38555.1 hypothetical protein CEH05_05235 [Halobacillus halophilus]